MSTVHNSGKTGKQGRSLSGSFDWIKKNLFSSPLNTIITLVLAYGIVSFGFYILRWVFLDATWVGDTKEACSATGGACWAFIVEKFRFFIFGFYPKDKLWRPLLVFVLLGISTYIMFRKKTVRLSRTFLFMFLVMPALTYVILHGFGSGTVIPDSWGGLLLTLILSYTGLLLSFPFGLVFAVLRTSKLRLVRVLIVSFIEFFRGIPLITILFLSAVVLPLFLPPSLQIPKLFRLVAGLTIFQTVYLAEVIRGGLLAVERGQYEAAKSLGMSSFVSNYLVILPQALRLSIPNITSITIAFVKDSSLVIVVGWFDLLGVVKPLSSDVNWLGMEPEGYFFVALVFWFLCVTVSRIGTKMEDRFNKYMTASH